MSFGLCQTTLHTLGRKGQTSKQCEVNLEWVRCIHSALPQWQKFYTVNLAVRLSWNDSGRIHIAAGIEE